MHCSSVSIVTDWVLDDGDLIPDRSRYLTVGHHVESPCLMGTGAFSGGNVAVS